MPTCDGCKTESRDAHVVSRNKGEGEANRMMDLKRKDELLEDLGRKIAHHCARVEKLCREYGLESIDEATIIARATNDPQMYVIVTPAGEDKLKAIGALIDSEHEIHVHRVRQD